MLHNLPKCIKDVKIVYKPGLNTQKFFPGAQPPDPPFGPPFLLFLYPPLMMSAFQHPEPIAEYIEKELKRSRMLGPFPVGGRLQSAIQISRFGVIPKGHNEGKWRLITDLSYPTGHSVNDGINPALCSLRYITVEIVASEAAALGPGALIAKVDIESAYRLVPVHQDDRSLLGLAKAGRQAV